MKKLSSGWQYTVYDIGNGRVLKRFHPIWRAVYVITRDIFIDSFRMRRHALKSILVNVRLMRSLAQTSLAGIQKHSEIDPRCFASPTFFLPSLNYEQDIATVIRKVLPKLSFANQKSLVDKFADFAYMLYEHDIVEQSFNITENFGVDKEGNIILTDLGELHFDKEYLQSIVTKRPWSERSMTRLLPSAELEVYFVRKMDERFGITVEGVVV